MAAQNLMYNQTSDFSDINKFKHVSPYSDMAEGDRPAPNHKVQAFGPENCAFTNDFADHLLHSWDGHGDLSCSLAQDDPFSFGSIMFHSEGDGTSLDARFEALDTSFDLLPKFQTKNSSLDLVSDLLAAECSMPGEETLIDIPSSNAVPITPGNS